MSKPSAHTPDQYYTHIPITTRWMDNDIYGHVNNVVYYSYFDTIVNQFLIERGGLDIANGHNIGLIVHSKCDYHASIAFPIQIKGGFRVNRLGNSSVEYGVAIFADDSKTACAQGVLTHVFVERSSQKPVRITGKLRAALESAVMPEI
ncbi:acyl-CoA thioesterase [Glaciecola siphonariae]|uniref:Acyl-CoA thioesterase n=1 Tax=Glaciecola siphonariae TaxID=521012 RepID=A0ABV9LZA3_9ALTE